MRKVLLALSVIAIISIAAVELFARYYLQLGDPPLSVADPDMEYMFKPNQDVYRFGNHIIFNKWGMRNYDFSVKKGPGETRVLVLGDSVVNGGNLTDHEALATTILTKNTRLVMNASAGSWGPENMLAYVRRFGMFGADHIVVVLSSHDAADVPTFAPLSPTTHPTEMPLLAVIEGIQRYLPRYLRRRGTATAQADRDEAPSDPAAIAAIAELARLPAKVCFVLHPTKTELLSGIYPARFAEIRAAVGDATVVDEWPNLEPTIDYRDDIHPSYQGQRILALTIRNGCRI